MSTSRNYVLEACGKRGVDDLAHANQRIPAYPVGDTNEAMRLPGPVPATGEVFIAIQAPGYQ